MELNLQQLNHEFEEESVEAIISWAAKTFSPNIAMTSSFQSQSIPLLHIISRTVPQLPVIFLDTGYHFPETLAFRDWLAANWGLNVKTVKNTDSIDKSLQPNDQYRLNPDLCCYVNKVIPMRKATESLDAWISGVRRDQSYDRVDLEILEETDLGLVRVHPMAGWTHHDIWKYIANYNLPTHPLLSEGYLSIGCAPCTRPVDLEEEARSGRWREQNKTECGLHTKLRKRKLSLPNIG